MPLYEYICFDCDARVEELREMRNRNKPSTCGGCGNAMEMLYSVPAMHVWEAGRTFPNLDGAGDGSMAFPTKAAYQKHLTAHGIGEASTTTPNYNKPSVWKKTYA